MFRRKKKGVSRMEITYLHNSGFLVKSGRTLLVFDDCEDPVKAVDCSVDEMDFDHLYFLVSHAHSDHFDTHIRAYSDKADKYIFSNDIRHTKRGRLFPPDKLLFMKKYETWEDGNITVRSYDSTDVGTCFYVEMPEESVFHAGDFNWWHWDDEPQTNQILAKNAFRKQMKRLEGLDVDVAFFPVDGRMGEACAMGAKEFCARTKTRALVTMHNVGFAAWQPPKDFFAVGREIPVWSPVQPGEKITIGKGVSE